MDTELKKITVQTGEILFPSDTAVLIEGDVIVPDVKPDAIKIMSADADATIKKCEVSGNLLKISGTVFVNILYMPEGEDAHPSAINTRFDFSENIKLASNENIKANAQCAVRHIDFSLINSRKLNLKIYVGLNTASYQKKLFEYIDNPDDEKILELKKGKFKLFNIIDNVKNEIIVSENIEIPQSKADIGEVLKICLEPRVGEYKALNDKVLVKGSILVNMLYITKDSDEDAECINAEIPFSDVFDVDDVDENSHINVNFSIKDYYYNIKNDINDNPRVVSLEALTDVNIFAYNLLDCEPVVDCYIPGSDSELSKKEISAGELIFCDDIKLNIREKIITSAENVTEILSCCTKLIISEQIISSGSIEVKGLLAGSIVAKTDDDTLIFDTIETPFEHTQNISGINDKTSVFCTPSIVSKSFNISGGEAEFFGVINLGILAVNPICFNVISDCVPLESTDTRSQPMLVIYFVQANDTVWDIAKRYKTTVEKIYSANNLTENDKISAGMKLLIPSV